MTPEEIQKKSNDKIKAVETLLKQLELSIEAKQVLTKEGIIENVVFYRDLQKYPKPAPVKPVNPAPAEEKKDVKPTTV
jgi:hypothetical protein